MPKFFGKSNYSPNISHVPLYNIVYNHFLRINLTYFSVGKRQAWHRDRNNDFKVGEPYKGAQPNNNKIIKGREERERGSPMPHYPGPDSYDRDHSIGLSSWTRSGHRSCGSCTRQTSHSTPVPLYSEDSLTAKAVHSNLSPPVSESTIIPAFNCWWDFALLHAF